MPFNVLEIEIAFCVIDFIAQTISPACRFYKGVQIKIKNDKSNENIHKKIGHTT